MRKLAAQTADPQTIKMIEDMQSNTECCSQSVAEKSHQNDKPRLTGAPVLYIFMSFSVPRQVWKDLWKQVDRYPFQFVLRGLPENSFQKLAEKIKDYGCPVTINPDLFTKFGVTAVPTFIWVHKGIVKGVQGNISLACAMEHLNV